MDIYSEKAKELGNLILASEESKRLADAQAIYKENIEAVKKMEEYAKYKNDVVTAMESGHMDDNAYKAASAKLNDLGNELKAVPVIAELVRAENDFNSFVNDIMNVLKITITGEASACGSGCGGCGGGCEHTH